VTEQDAALAAAAELAASFQAMTAQMERLARTTRRNRRVIAALAASFALDLAVTAGLGYNTVRVNSAQDGIRASDIRQCQLANVSRGQDIAIWSRLLRLPPGMKATAAQKAEVAELKHLVGVKDTPRDCQAAYNAKGGTPGGRNG
jgi:hypothetical protein